MTQSASVAKATATLMIAFQGSSQANFVQWDPIWAAWQQAHPEIKTEHDGFEGLGVSQYGEKLITLLAGGTSYDALHVHYTIAGEFMASKLVRPIDSLIAQDAAAVNMDDYAPGLLAAFAWQGKRYGLPIEANPWLLWYNSDLFKKYGVPAPTDLVQAKQWTWTGGFRQRAQAATHVDANPPVYGYGGWQQGTGSSGYAGWGAAVWANGGDLWTSDKSALALDQPPALEALQFWADLSNKDKVAPPQDQPKLWDHSSGTIGMGLFAPFTVPNFDKYHWQPDMVVNPSGSAGLFHNSGSSMYSIATTAKNPDLAWTWAKWISDDGIKVWLDKGFFTGPPRKSLASYPGWVKSRKPWENVDSWAQATATIRLPFGVPNWTPIMTALAGELDKAMQGKQTVAEAIAKVKAPINSLLKQGLT